MARIVSSTGADSVREQQLDEERKVHVGNEVRAGTRLDDLGKLVVDAAAKEVGADNDIIVSRHACQQFWASSATSMRPSTNIERSWTLSRAPESSSTLSLMPVAKCAWLAMSLYCSHSVFPCSIARHVPAPVSLVVELVIVATILEVVLGDRLVVASQAVGNEHRQNPRRHDDAELVVKAGDANSAVSMMLMSVSPVTPRVRKARTRSSSLRFSSSPMNRKTGTPGSTSLEGAVEEVGRGDVAGALPLHLLQDAHQTGWSHPTGAGADEHGVGPGRTFLASSSARGLRSACGYRACPPDVLGLPDKQVKLGEAAAAVEQAQAEAVGEVVALSQPPGTMVRSHGDAVPAPTAWPMGPSGLVMA